MPKTYRRGADRFWHYVVRGGEDDCWLWTGPKNNAGYGVFTTSRPYRTSTTAHRYAWELGNGALERGLVVRHRCDVPLCCNPGHLEPGTPKDNTADMVARGRGDWQNGHKREWAPRVRKLSDDSVREIRRLGAAGNLRAWDIADRFGCGEAHVYAILAGKRKAHVV